MVNEDSGREQHAKSTCPTVTQGMPDLHLVRSVLAIVLLAGINGDGQAVLFRRERARGVRRDCAWGVIRSVKVEHHLAIDDRIGV
jgi:hypothetical protein